jgi:hypothetical protein
MGNEEPGSGLVGSFSVGSKIASYRLEEQIGRGGMAGVFRAQDERLRAPGRRYVLRSAKAGVPRHHRHALVPAEWRLAGQQLERGAGLR